MYGPPPDPLQQYAPTGMWGAWEAWLGVFLVGVLICVLAKPKRPFLFVLGATTALTTPVAWFFPTYVWGAFPTIDKAGSLLFYLDGVHLRGWDPTDPAVKLIGVHMGHLWIVSFFDLFLEPFAAFNAQAFLNVVLGWYCAYLFLHEASGHRDASLLLAAPFGLGLHVFRDINWYTVEKSAVYWIPLFAWALLRAHRRGGRWIGVAALVYAGATFTNVYWGILGAGMGAVALFARSRNVALAVAASALAGLPLFAYQLLLSRAPGALGGADPQLFLTERAALDVFELWPPRWNRLEAWRALDLVALVLAATGLRRDWRIALAALPFFVLSLGPEHNPLYMALFHWVPGFWRFAKPETFFHVAWLAALCMAARTLAARNARPGAIRALAALMLAGWLISVRTHPVYPRFTRYVDLTLSEGWQRTLPRSGTLPR